MPLTAPAQAVSPTPHWDEGRRTLFFDGQVVKRFRRQPAKNQGLILAAFEELRWTPRIDDPLPGQPRIDPKQRRRDAVRSLNCRQLNPLVLFEADGTGTGITWRRRS
jgi:hypothetical protein